MTPSCVALLALEPEIRDLQARRIVSHDALDILREAGRALRVDVERPSVAHRALPVWVRVSFMLPLGALTVSGAAVDRCWQSGQKTAADGLIGQGMKVGEGQMN
jgi:hypothetical protein